MTYAVERAFRRHYGQVYRPSRAVIGSASPSFRIRTARAVELAQALTPLPAG